MRCLLCGDGHWTNRCAILQLPLIAKNPRITEVSKSCHDWLVPMNIISHKGRKE